MLTVIIKGAQSPERLRDIQSIVGMTSVFRKGTDPHLFVNYHSRERANLEVIRLNELHGVHAHILELTDAHSQTV